MRCAGTRYHYRLFVDFIKIGISILVAYYLITSGNLQFLFEYSRGMGIVGSFIAGLCFVSVFTVAPAAVMFAEFAHPDTLLQVAFWGGIGALIMDFVIFRFVRDDFSVDVMNTLRETECRRILHVLQSRRFKRVIPFLGAIIVASPLPDELGLAMMGISKVSTTRFIPISFMLNFTGILIIEIFALVF